MKKYTTADRLKQIMQERNLRQVDILRLCEPYCKKFDEKIDKSHLSLYVSGQATPNQRKLSILSMALNVSEVWLMGYDTNEIKTMEKDKLSDVGEKIKQKRIERDITQEELAKAINTTKQTIYKYEQGIVTNIPSDKIELIAKALDVSPAYLMGWEDENELPPYPNIYPIKTKKFPLLGEIACGEPIFASEDHESYIEARADIKADFCLKAKGDSMINARIMDGDIVFIRKQPTVNNGQIAAVIIEDEATLKRVYYYPEKGKLLLQAENPDYEPLMYVGEELNQIRIIGLAVAFQSDVR